MKGDYLRYLCEFTSGAEEQESRQKGLLAYEAATDVATNELPSTHPIRLGLALNLSVFYYEIMGNPAKAAAVAKNAFDEAIGAVDALSEESYKETSSILMLLRDGVTISNEEER